MLHGAQYKLVYFVEWRSRFITGAYGEQLIYGQPCVLVFVVSHRWRVLPPRERLFEQLKFFFLYQDKTLITPSNLFKLCYHVLSTGFFLFHLSRHKVLLLFLFWVKLPLTLGTFVIIFPLKGKKKRETFFIMIFFMKHKLEMECFFNEMSCGVDVSAVLLGIVKQSSCL